MGDRQPRRGPPGEPVPAGRGLPAGHGGQAHCPGRPGRRAGVRRARSAALLLFALPGSAYIYQGEELGLPEVTAIPDARPAGSTVLPQRGARPRPRRLPGSAALDRTGRTTASRPVRPGRHGCPSHRTGGGTASRPSRPAGFVPRAVPGGPAAAPPASGPGPGRYALAGRSRRRPALFAREPGFVFTANLGPAPVPLPGHREILLASEPLAGRQPAARRGRLAFSLRAHSASIQRIALT